MVDASLAYEILMYLNSFYFGKELLLGLSWSIGHFFKSIVTFTGLLAFVELGVFIYKMGKSTFYYDKIRG